MIKCPLCDQLVLDSKTGKLNLEDNDLQDFYCPKMGFIDSHYYRKEAWSGYNTIPVYMITTPHQTFEWIDETCYIYQGDKRQLSRPKIMSLEQAIKEAQRYYNLKAFA